MLPPAHRLKHWRDFQVVYRQGIRRSGRNLMLRGRRQNLELENTSIAVQSHKHEGKQPTRIGISISQKVSKKAVVRNRIKRLLRAALRQLLPRISANWQLVVVVRPSALECDYGQFLQELEQLLVEAEVINGH